MTPEELKNLTTLAIKRSNTGDGFVAWKQIYNYFKSLHPELKLVRDISGHLPTTAQESRELSQIFKALDGDLNKLYNCVKKLWLYNENWKPDY